MQPPAAAVLCASRRFSIELFDLVCCADAGGSPECVSVVDWGGLVDGAVLVDAGPACRPLQQEQTVDEKLVEGGELGDWVARQ